MNREWFVFYQSFFNAGKNLPDEHRLAFYDRILQYGIDGEDVPSWDVICEAMFLLVKPQIDANNKRFLNGKLWAGHWEKWGRPKTKIENEKPQENPTETPRKPQENPTETPKEKEKEKENVKDKDKDIVSNITNIETNTSLSLTKVIDKPVSNETEKPEYWNPEINKMLAFLKKAVWVSDFKESVQMQRRYTQILCHMKNKIWVEEFAFRIKTILQDGFKAKNCNKISYLHGELKGFTHSPVVEVQDDRKIRTFEV